MTKIIFHGHSFLEIEHEHRSILIDPFVEGNTYCDTSLKHVKHLGIDAIILTHGHADHVGDTPAIAKTSGGQVVGEFQLMRYLQDEHGIKNIHGMNVGGEHNFGHYSVKLFQAHHGGGIGAKPYKYSTLATSVLLRINGKTIFHAGDTGLHRDLELLGAYEHIDYAFLPIGDNFTMGIKDASIAAQMIKAKHIVPIHYNTRDVIAADPNTFKTNIESLGMQCSVMNPGEFLER